ADQLAVKRSDANALLEKATKARQDALLSGDLDDRRALDRLQAVIDTAASALTGIDDAINVLTQQKVEADAQLAAERDRVARAAAADQLEKQIAAIEAGIAPWLENSRIWSDALSELAHWHFGADEMVKFLQSCMSQLEIAANFQLAELKAMPQMIRDGRQPLPPKKQPAPVAITEQPPPTMTVFMLKSARFRDHNGHKIFAGQFLDQAMPVALAQKAMRLGLAVTTADPIRATHHGARGGDYRPDAIDVIDIDEAEEHSGVPFIGPDPVVRAAN